MHTSQDAHAQLRPFRLIPHPCHLACCYVLVVQEEKWGWVPAIPEEVVGAAADGAELLEVPVGRVRQ
jgi:hypothetical protein